MLDIPPYRLTPFFSLRICANGFFILAKSFVHILVYIMLWLDVIIQPDKKTDDNIHLRAKESVCG